MLILCLGPKKKHSDHLSFRINRGKKFGLTVLNYMGKIGVLGVQKGKIPINRVELTESSTGMIWSITSELTTLSFRKGCTDGEKKPIL